MSCHDVWNSLLGEHLDCVIQCCVGVRNIICLLGISQSFFPICKVTVELAHEVIISELPGRQLLDLMTQDQIQKRLSFLESPHQIGVSLGEEQD